MIRKSQMQTLLLTFTGGPLDGEKRRRQARTDWTVIQYTEPSDADRSLRHVWAGTRISPQQIKVPMRYLGLTRGGESET